MKRERAADAPRQQLQRLGLVAVLAPLVLDRDHGVRGEVRRAHGAVCGIDVLAAGTLCAICIDAEIAVVDFHIHFFGFRKHGDGRSRSMDPTAGFGFRHTLDAVYA